MRRVQVWNQRSSLLTDDSGYWGELLRISRTFLSVSAAAVSQCKWKYLWSKCNSYVCENVIKLRGKMWFLRQINLTLVGILLVYNLLLLLFTQLLFCQLSGEGQIYFPLHFCFFDEGNSFDDKTGMMLHILNSEGADRNWNLPPHGNFYKLQTHSVF